MKKRVLILFAATVLLLFAAPLAVQAEDGTISYVSYSKTGTDWTYQSEFLLPDLSNGFTSWKCQIGDISIDLGSFNRPLRNENLVYTGQAQALLTADSGTITPGTAGAAAHYEYQAIETELYGDPDPEDIDETKWSSEKPVETIPGTYIIWVRLVVEYNGNQYYFGPDNFSDMSWSSFGLKVTINKFSPSDSTVKVENFDVPTYAQLQEYDFEWDEDFEVYIKITDSWTLLESSAYTCYFYDPTGIESGNSNIFYIEIAESDCYKESDIFFNYHIQGNTLTVKTKLSAPDLSYTGAAQPLLTPFGFEGEVTLPITYYAVWYPLDAECGIPSDFFEDYEKYEELAEMVESYDSNGVPLGTKAGFYIIMYNMDPSELDAAYEEEYVSEVLAENIDSDTDEDFMVVKILPQELTLQDVIISQKQDVTTVKWGELTLEEGTDYTLTSDFSEGIGTITLDFNKEDFAGNYTGTVNCAYQAAGDETGITFVSAAEDLVDTLTGAAAGELVILTGDIVQANGYYLAVRSGVTLDLNGHSISGAELFYVTGTIRDTASAKGLVSAAAYFINNGQEYLPVYNATGYSFYKLTAEARAKTDDATGKTTYKFRIDTASADYGVLKELIGATEQSAAAFTANSKLKVTAVFSWTDNNGAVSQTVTFSPALLQAYFKSSDTKALTLSVTGINSISSEITLKFNLVAMSPEGNDLACISIGEPLTIQEAQ